MVEARVKAEVEKRATALDKALSVRSQVASELKKQDRPDVKTYNGDGTVASETYSEERFKEVKKLKEKLGKIDKTINLALNNSEWGKLNEVKG